MGTPQFPKDSQGALVEAIITAIRAEGLLPPAVIHPASLPASQALSISNASEQPVRGAGIDQSPAMPKRACGDPGNPRTSPDIGNINPGPGVRMTSKGSRYTTARLPPAESSVPTPEAHWQKERPEPKESGCIRQSNHPGPSQAHSSRTEALPLELSSSVSHHQRTQKSLSH